MQIIADVDGLEQMKFGFKLFNPIRITIVKIRAQWAGKVKYQQCTLINQVDYPPLSSFCYRSSSERRKPLDVLLKILGRDNNLN